MGAGTAFTAVLTIVLLVLGLRWYIKRARQVSAANDARYDFQRAILLDLQDIRDGMGGNLILSLDELIEMVRYDTPANNEKTTELDNRIAGEVQQLANNPTAEGIAHIKAMITSRNRRAVR